MKNMMYLGLLALALTAQTARADLSFACGQGREKGPEKSEIGFLNELEHPMRLFVGGKEVPDEKLGTKPMSGGLWMASIDRGEGKGTSKYVFAEKDASVQEYSVSEKGDEKKVGAKKKCVFTLKKDK